MAGTRQVWGRNVYSDLVGQPEQERRLSKSRRRWEYTEQDGWAWTGSKWHRDCIDVAQDCVDVAQERNKWGAAVNVVMNLLVPLSASEGPRCL